jgi:hypothetical protein
MDVRISPRPTFTPDPPDRPAFPSPLAEQVRKLEERLTKLEALVQSLISKE